MKVRQLAEKLAIQITASKPVPVCYLLELACFQPTTLSSLYEEIPKQTQHLPTRRFLQPFVESAKLLKLASWTVLPMLAIVACSFRMVLGIQCICKLWLHWSECKGCRGAALPVKDGLSDESACT